MLRLSGFCCKAVRRLELKMSPKRAGVAKVQVSLPDG